MGDWFTVEAVSGDTFAISEYGHWEQAHCYLLCGRTHALLIDAGLGVGDLGAVVRSITDLPVLAAVTHVHWDHIGGLGSFPQFAVHETERGWLAGHFPLPPKVVKAQLTAHPCAFPPGFRLQDYRVFQGEPQRLLHDGDLIDLGGRIITAVHTPGHSPGHCCFYEEARRCLFTGDLIYRGCLDAFYPSTDPLQLWHSVQKILRLPADRLRPGHGSLDVQPALAKRVETAFAGLYQAGRLRQGAGRFDFGAFQIRL